MKDLPIADFLTRQLKFVRRRGTPTERAECNWWLARVEALKIERDQAFKQTSARELATTSTHGEN